MESEIMDYISRELVSEPGLLPLENGTQLLETGILDSLALLKLLLFLEEKFNVIMDDFELIPDNFSSVEAICDYIRSQKGLQVT